MLLWLKEKTLHNFPKERFTIQNTTWMNIIHTGYYYIFFFKEQDILGADLSFTFSAVTGEPPVFPSCVELAVLLFSSVTEPSVLYKYFVSFLSVQDYRSPYRNNQLLPGQETSGQKQTETVKDQTEDEKIK